jgi:hypothetical protein
LAKILGVLGILEVMFLREICERLLINSFGSMKVVHEGLVSMLGFVISIFHEFVIIS